MRSYGVAASVGTATRRTGENLADTWQRADTEMYRDKRGKPRGVGVVDP